METTWCHNVSVSYVYEDLSQKVWALAARLVDYHQLLDEHWNPHLWDRDESKGICQTKFFESRNTKLIKHVILGLPFVHNWPGWHTSARQLRESILDCLLSRRSSFVPSVMNHAWRSAAHIHIWKLSCIHHINFLCCVLVYIDAVCSSIHQSTGTLLQDYKVSHPILRLLFPLKLCITETRKKWFITWKITVQNWLDINFLNNVGWQKWANRVLCREPWFDLCGFLY